MTRQQVSAATLSIALVLLVVDFVVFDHAAAASPALQLPWPSGHQHRISGGNSYNCDTHDRQTASGNPPLYNADQFALDFQFGTADGSPLDVAAAASGTVVYRANNFDLYGNKVVIDHGGGLVSVYAHLKTNSWAPGVSVGAQVWAGQLLADAGGTGDSEGQYPVHLHFHMMLDSSSYQPEPMSGVWGFGGYGNCATPTSPYWTSRPVWQPNGAYQPYGTPWTGTTGATAAASDFSQYNHSVLARVNSGSVQWKRSLGGASWGSWSTISGLSGVNGKIAISNHRNGGQDQVHAAAVKNGDLWYTSKVGTGGWATWLNIGHPSGATLDGAIAIGNSDVRVLVVGISNGNVYWRMRTNGSWSGVWTPLGGANTLTGSLAIAVRPNGMIHIVALRFDGHIHITCTTNYTIWTGWTDIGWIFGDALAVDNDAASGSCGTTSNPGVVVLAFSSLVGFVFCWEPYCSLYEPIGGAVEGPAAISNAVNPYSGNIRWIDVVVRSSNSALHRYRVY